MINSRHLNKIVVVLIILSLLACVLIVYLAQVKPNKKIMPYESKLFGDEMLSIDIQVDEKDWQELLDVPVAKEYISADLIINGEMFSSVGLRTKGNSSLNQVAQMKDSDRYSIHFKFDQYQKGQHCYGLDTFCINNLVGDTTYMKEYLSFDIMNYIGVPAPLTNYAKVTVNGEDFGFFLALERYEKSFLDRVYDTSGGQLYNVKMQMGQHGGNPPDGNRGQNEDVPPNPMGRSIEAPNNAEFPRGNFNPGMIEQNDTGSSQDTINQNPPDQNWPPGDDQNRSAGGFPKEMAGRFPGGMAGGRGGGGSCLCR